MLISLIIAQKYHVHYGTKESKLYDFISFIHVFFSIPKQRYNNLFRKPSTKLTTRAMHKVILETLYIILVFIRVSLNDKSLDTTELQWMLKIIGSKCATLAFIHQKVYKLKSLHVDEISLRPISCVN